MKETVFKFKIPSLVAKDSVKLDECRSTPFVAPCDFSVLQIYFFETVEVYCVLNLLLNLRFRFRLLLSLSR